MKNYHHFPSSAPRRANAHGVDGIFAWTIFIFLLMGFALFCWIGSFYVFGHPEKAPNYHLLMRLHKLEEPQRFELTEAPRGEFLKPKQLLERFGPLTHREIRKLNDGLLANFLRNYHQTHHLTPYVTETYRVLEAFPLTKKNFFYPGVCALLQSVDQPEILLEQIFPATDHKLISKVDRGGEAKKLSETRTHAIREVIGEANTETSTSDYLKKIDKDIVPLEHFLIPGQEIKFEKPLDLSAILHVEKLPDGRLKFTTISLLYGSYGPTNNGPALFSLAPPVNLNVEAGLPILTLKDLASAEAQYEAYRTKMGFSKTNPHQEEPQPYSAFVLQIISSKPIAPIKKTFQKNTSRLEKVTASKTTPITLPKVAKALPSNTSTPLSLPARLPATSSSTSVSTLPASTTSSTTPQNNSGVQSSEETASTLATANQSVLPTPTSFTIASATTETWPTYDPGKMPRGRFVTSSQFGNLAEQGLAGERLYLQGDFAVTASGQNRSVLRYQANTSSLPPDQISKIRIIATYPPGIMPPAEGISVTRNQDHPFMITDVKKGNDGTVNVYVKEIVK